MSSAAAEGSSRDTAAFGTGTSGSSSSNNPLRSPTRTAATRSSAARTSTGGARLSAGGLNAGSTTSSPSLHGRTRQSLFGESDRVVLDIGLSIARYGFEGESRPRGLFSTSQYALWSPHFWKGCKDERQRRSRELELLVNLTELLRRIFYQELLIDPRARKVIVVENALLPDYAARTLSRVLFANLQVAAVAFLPAPLTSLLATGCMTGLVLDVGTYHSRLTTVYHGRLLCSKPDMLVTTRGSHRLKKRLKSLLLCFGRYVAATPTTVSRKHRTAKINPELLDDAFLDLIIAKTVFVAQKPIEDIESQRREDSGRSAADAPAATAARPTQSTFGLTPASSQPESRLFEPYEEGYDEGRDEVLMRHLHARYAHTSKATSLVLPVPFGITADPHAPVLQNTTMGSATHPQPQQQRRDQANGVIVVPNWIRERAVDVLFEPGDDDEKSLPELICDTLINLPIDMRLPLAKQILVVGGVATMSGFAHRLKEEVTRLLDNCSIDQAHSIALTLPRVGFWAGKATRNTSQVLTSKDVNKDQSGSSPSAAGPQADGVSLQSKAPYREIMRYAPIAHLWQHVSFMNDHAPYRHSNHEAQGGDAPAFAANVIAWVGASLAGSIRTGSVCEKTKEAWEEAEALERERLNRMGNNDDTNGARPLFGSGRGSFVGVVGGIHTGAWGALSAHLRAGPRSPAPNTATR